MHQTAFEPAYTGFTADGARWLVANMPSVRPGWHCFVRRGKGAACQPALRQWHPDLLDVLCALQTM